MEIEELVNKITDVFAYQFKDCELNCEKQEVRNILKQALAEAKREGVRDLVEKLDKQKCCCEECSLWHSKICDANKDCILAIAIGVIKKVEEI